MAFKEVNETRFHKGMRVFFVPNEALQNSLNSEKAMAKVVGERAGIKMNTGSFPGEFSFVFC
jgi:hypothetical protein